MKQPETLEDYAVLMNDEYGEYLENLYLISRRKYLMSDAFAAAVDAECAEQLEYLNENTRLVEHREDDKVDGHTSYELVFDDE